MAKPTTTDIREAILEEIGGTDGPMQQVTVLRAVTERLGIRRGDDEREQAVLTQWHDLYRTGYFAWGLNLANPDPPFFHLTERGRRALERLSRDPGNPAGYLRHLYSVSKPNAIADSYAREGLDCFVADLHKAAAVMIGAAAESLILGLRDTVVQKVKSLGQAPAKNLLDWRVKVVLDELQSFLDNRKSQFPKELREGFEASWSTFAYQIRTVRNDAGHPASVDPVTYDGVHASFLVFPELARLATGLNEWVTNHLT